jgi:hypothetical protein
MVKKPSKSQQPNKNLNTVKQKLLKEVIIKGQNREESEKINNGETK